MTKPVAFIDMDGVVADFVGRVLALAGTPNAEGASGEYAVPGISDERLWEIVNGDPMFWSGLDLYPWATELVDCVANVFGKKNTYFFSAPSRSSRCTSGKIEWLYKHFPRYRRQFFIGAHKWMCASSMTVLIDDRDETVDKFREHGGWALLFPQRWNSLHAIPDESRCAHVLQALPEIYWDIKGNI